MTACSSHWQGVQRVNPEVHAIYIKRIGFSLIRVHRQQTFSAQNSTDEVLLQQLKWPIEYMQVGMRMEDYNSTSETLQRQYLDVWNRFCSISYETHEDTGFMCYKKEILTGTEVSLDVSTVGLEGTVTGVGTEFDTEIAAGEFIVINDIPYVVVQVVSASTVLLGSTTTQPLPPANLTSTNFYKFVRTPKTYQVQVETPTIEAITITAHGIYIYNDYPALFFTAYQPFQYGGPNLNTPSEEGALFINFCLYPNSYQPSGHINISRAREFYLRYVASIITSSNRGTLIVVASAINFLLISDGSAVLRYST